VGEDKSTPHFQVKKEKKTEILVTLAAEEGEIGVFSVTQ